MLHEGNVLVFVLESVDFFFDSFAFNKVGQVFFPHPNLKNNPKHKKQNNEAEVQVNLVNFTFQSISKDPFLMFWENWNSFGKWPIGIDSARMKT